MRKILIAQCAHCLLNKRIEAKKLCFNCYKKHGATYPSSRPRKLIGTCMQDKCTKIKYAKNLCVLHYQQYRKRLHPYPKKLCGDCGRTKMLSTRKPPLCHNCYIHHRAGKIRTPKKNRLRICISCNFEKLITARGLCRRCYDKLKPNKEQS